MDYEDKSPEDKLRAMQKGLRVVRWDSFSRSFLKPIANLVEKIEYDLAEIEGDIRAEKSNGQGKT